MLSILVAVTEEEAIADQVISAEERKRPTNTNSSPISSFTFAQGLVDEHVISLIPSVGWEWSPFRRVKTCLACSASWRTNARHYNSVAPPEAKCLTSGRNYLINGCTWEEIRASGWIRDRWLAAAGRWDRHQGGWKPLSMVREHINKPITLINFTRDR